MGLRPGGGNRHRFRRRIPRVAPGQPCHRKCRPGIPRSAQRRLVAAFCPDTTKSEKSACPQAVIFPSSRSTIFCLSIGAETSKKRNWSRRLSLIRSSPAPAKTRGDILPGIRHSDFENVVSSPPASYSSLLRVRLKFCEIDVRWRIYFGPQHSS